MDWFDETGAEYTIQVALLKDIVTLTIDTSGSSLHKRGYRANALDAPLKDCLLYTSSMERQSIKNIQTE